MATHLWSAGAAVVAAWLVTAAGATEVPFTFVDVAEGDPNFVPLVGAEAINGDFTINPFNPASVAGDGSDERTRWAQGFPQVLPLLDQGAVFTEVFIELEGTLNGTEPQTDSFDLADLDQPDIDVDIPFTPIGETVELTFDLLAFLGGSEAVADYLLLDEKDSGDVVGGVGDFVFFYQDDLLITKSTVTLSGTYVRDGDPVIVPTPTAIAALPVLLLVVGRRHRRGVRACLE